MAKTEKVINKIPASQIVWVEQRAGDKTFYITSDISRTTYFLYYESENGYKQIDSAPNPLEFDKAINKFKEGKA